MKKFLFTILLLTGGLLCLFLWIYSPVPELSDEVIEFVNNGNETVELNIERDSMYVDGVDPYGVYNKPQGVISNDTMAVEYAKMILSQIYGMEHIKKQRPYSVKLYNGKIWSVTGNLSSNTEGGVFSILISKLDGQVLMISHTK